MDIIARIIFVTGWVLVGAVATFIVRWGLGGGEDEFDEMEREQEALAALGRSQARNSGIAIACHGPRPFDWNNDDLYLSDYRLRSDR